jgi:hypothetical protein
LIFHVIHLLRTTHLLSPDHKNLLEVYAFHINFVARSFVEHIDFIIGDIEQVEVEISLVNISVGS